LSFAEIFGVRKRRVPGLSCSVVCVILRLSVSVEHGLVTDRQTYTETDDYGIYRASMTSGDKYITRDQHLLRWATV